MHVDRTSMDLSILYLRDHRYIFFFLNHDALFMKSVLSL